MAVSICNLQTVVELEAIPIEVHHGGLVECKDLAKLSRVVEVADFYGHFVSDVVDFIQNHVRL